MPFTWRVNSVELFPYWRVIHSEQRTRFGHKEPCEISSNGMLGMVCSSRQIRLLSVKLYLCDASSLGLPIRRSAPHSANCVKTFILCLLLLVKNSRLLEVFFKRLSRISHWNKFHLCASMAMRFMCFDFWYWFWYLIWFDFLSEEHLTFNMIRWSSSEALLLANTALGHYLTLPSTQNIASLQIT